MLLRVSYQSSGSRYHTDSNYNTVMQNYSIYTTVSKAHCLGKSQQKQTRESFELKVLSMNV